MAMEFDQVIVSQRVRVYYYKKQGLKYLDQGIERRPSAKPSTTVNVFMRFLATHENIANILPA